MALSFPDPGDPRRGPQSAQRQPGGARAFFAVAAFELLDGRLRQPDGSLLYDLLTRVPGRRPGERVDITVIARELGAAGLSFPAVGIDVLAVATGLVELVRRGQLRPLAP